MSEVETTNTEPEVVDDAPKPAPPCPALCQPVHVYQSRVWQGPRAGFVSNVREIEDGFILCDVTVLGNGSRDGAFETLSLLAIPFCNTDAPTHCVPAEIGVVGGLAAAVDPAVAGAIAGLTTQRGELSAELDALTSRVAELDDPVARDGNDTETDAG